jgi:alkanesulfonate monooxygenase SsuD/methylene tetrahydromethanopterin reductase-like flavin-dependent oxidoreductase (luciferase family)
VRIGVIVPLTRQTGDGELPGWPDIRAFVEQAEGLGIHSAWVFDHLYSMGSGGPTEIHEAWSIQTALAAVTSRIELGQLVSCTSFRDPGMLAKAAVTVDEIAGGRLTLGLGAGWYDREYTDFGFPTDRRASRFEESLDVIMPLLRGETVTTHGTFHRVDGARLLPAPARHIPVLVAGHGPRMRGLAARHADAWNTAWYPAANDNLAVRLGEMRESLAEAGRDPATLRWTVGMLARHDDTAALGEAIAGFAERGIDDLIVSLLPATPAALDRLAKAAADRL